jgi:hypothetical protein
LYPRLAGNDTLDVAYIAGLDAGIEGQVISQNLAGDDFEQGQHVGRQIRQREI